MIGRNITFKPLLSVIVPFHNAESYLPECIDSIRNQTYTNLEIILVDNASTDNSGSICDIYRKRDHRIKVIYEGIRGAVAARKAGIREAVGEYSTYVDSDDWIDFNMYDVMLKRMGDADVIACGLEQNRNTKCIGYQKSAVLPGNYQGKSLEELYQKMIYTGRFYSWGVQSSTVSKIYKTELLRRNQLRVPDEIRMGEDPACLYPVLLEARKIVIIPECFYHYRIRNDSVTGIGCKNELERYKILFSYLKDRFTDYKQWKESLLYQLRYMMVYYLLFKNIEVFQYGDSFFPYTGVARGSKIVVYGAGRFGSEVARYLRGTRDYTFAAWVDKNSDDSIQSVEILREVDCDYILIAVLKEGLKEEIARQITEMGISREKIKMVDMDLIEKASAAVENILSGVVY